ncbi:MAG: class I SAM-dependent methyltransferase [Candidatus Liptonbacteria bacterium]|nr:class I SAM-dependent methyltransferase [Candidatus Liptonbacteria bacterium]
MPYDENFYRMYREYLQEQTVRRNHDHVFSLFASLLLHDSPRVMDLGCGIGEYATYDQQHAAYVGVDLNNTGSVIPFVQADYLKLNFGNLLPFLPNAFISLFSIECCHSSESKYTLYNRIFSTFPAVKYGLVGGFFYESRRNQETVSEAGEIVSYQTIEDPSLHISPLFTELRIHIRTPSRMFGNDVIEVWKLLVRK